MTNFSMQISPDTAALPRHGFLLVEPTMLDHAPELAAIDMRPCTPRVLAHREELMPRLVDVAKLDEASRNLVTACWSSETHIERPPLVCAWLESEASADTLCEHIARYLVGPGVEGTPVFWRFYDPRVLSLTLAVLDQQQQSALIGPIGAWHFAWAGHRWRVADRAASEADASQPSGWPRHDQWPVINCSETADRVLRRLPAMTAEQAAQLPDGLQRIFIEAMPAADTDALVEYAVQRVQGDFSLASAIQGLKP